ncbi:hypothetical protein CEUSTIGMA_g9733.t1 [Chlamydomonas eustigma]|uniref:Cilia- and flagella-associated protein 300 n=1 Tax=Chlamydomonas eustigma TaxID=1157962 RepID=A0A250XGV1_9CHLO|nr:hypothetical protein CEUSTIGMA_g9733.t1 [Chlamydomonas eustigma]|eukprot:GAX82304.1 hypothetical protein CEUSTIGMA_g9733.t1 [Chlamydomonas eustigma]
MSFFPATNSKSLFEDVFMKSQLKKWDMTKMQYKAFRYTKYYHKMQAEEFVLDLLNDPNFDLKVLSNSGEWLDFPKQIQSAEVEVIPCSLTRMDFFDKILTAEPAIVRQSGDIIKCMDDQREGFQVSDMLRQMLLCEESENAELYSDDEKSQFLWRIFEHICLGGACCQFEDVLEPYLDAAKKIYKETLSVQKNATTSKIEVVSVVYRIKSIKCESGPSSLFPTHSRNNFCYITVDPLRRLARFWYHGMMPFW